MTFVSSAFALFMGGFIMTLTLVGYDYHLDRKEIKVYDDAVEHPEKYRGFKEHGDQEKR